MVFYDSFSISNIWTITNSNTTKSDLLRKVSNIENEKDLKSKVWWNMKFDDTHYIFSRNPSWKLQHTWSNQIEQCLLVRQHWNPPSKVDPEFWLEVALWRDKGLGNPAMFRKNIWKWKKGQPICIFSWCLQSIRIQTLRRVVSSLFRFKACKVMVKKQFGWTVVF